MAVAAVVDDACDMTDRELVGSATAAPAPKTDLGESENT